MKQPNKFNSQLPTPTANFRLLPIVSTLIKTLLESLILEERDRGISGRRISGKLLYRTEVICFLFGRGNFY
jgi:hypothetical protein